MSKAIKRAERRLRQRLREIDDHLGRPWWSRRGCPNDRLNCNEEDPSGVICPFFEECYPK